MRPSAGDPRSLAGSRARARRAASAIRSAGDRVTIAIIPLFRKKLLAYFSWREGLSTTRLGRATGRGWAQPPCLHSRMKRLRGLPCRSCASAFCEHSIDLAERAAGSSAPARARPASFVGRRVKGMRCAAEEDAKRRGACQSVDPHLKIPRRRSTPDRRRLIGGARGFATRALQAFCSIAEGGRQRPGGALRAADAPPVHSKPSSSDFPISGLLSFWPNLSR